MKFAIRLGLCLCLVVVAVVMAAFTVADLTQADRGASGLLLADYEGSVAIFAGENRETPLQVTDIALASLRDADRKLVERGVPVADRETLASLLEDLGS